MKMGKIRVLYLARLSSAGENEIRFGRCQGRCLFGFWKKVNKAEQGPERSERSEARGSQSSA